LLAKRGSLLVVLAALLLLGRREEKLHLEAEDPDEAQRWFFRQRAFPFDEIPRGVRPKVMASAATNSVWHPIGPTPIFTTPSEASSNTGRVTAVAISPADSNVMVVGSSTGGIWRSTNGGGKFVPVIDTLADLSVGAIAFAPSNPNIVYAGLGEDRYGPGLLKSTDAGATWNAVAGSLPARSKTKKLLVDPLDENTLWLLQAGALSNEGSLVIRSSLYKSTDGGATWTASFSGVATDVLIASDDGRTLLLGATRFATIGTGGIYKSSDQGATWTRVLAGRDPSVPPKYFLAKSTGTFFAAVIDSPDGDTDEYRWMKSIDGGATWSEVAKFPYPRTIWYAAAHPTNPNYVYVGAVGALRSADGGATWTTLPVHVDQRAFAFDPRNPARLWLGNDGGLVYSNDYGATFGSLAELLPIVQFYAVSAHPTDPAVLYGGTQDNGLERRVAGTTAWKKLLGGDFGTVLFDRSDPRRILSQAFGFSVLRLREGSSNIEVAGDATTFGESTGQPRVSFIPAMAQGPDGTVWFGTWRVFASQDFGTKWTAPAPATDVTFGDDDCITAFGVAQSDARTLYTGSAEGRVMVTRDGGSTWTDATPPSKRYVTSIAVDRSSPGTAFAGLSGFSTSHVFKTTTYGAAWTDSSNGLPDVPVNAIYFDTKTPATMYAGTDAGVFRSLNGGADWHPFQNGMPSVVVTSFTTTADGRLIAGTYGRGAYELIDPMPDPRRRAVAH
jgi:photosystem II stability/assembly factor-like uncharacterized protein